MLFRSMSGLQVRNLTPQQLNELPLDQIANLKPVQLQALTTNQLSNLKPEVVETLSPAQLSVMSPRQLQALPSTSSADTSVKTGTLAITILNKGQSNPTSAVVTYEQSADSVSLKPTAAPTVATSTEKLVFSDKLSTFLVAQTNGEMIEIGRAHV